MAVNCGAVILTLGAADVAVEAAPGDPRVERRLEAAEVDLVLRRDAIGSVERRRTAGDDAAPGALPGRKGSRRLLRGSRSGVAQEGGFELLRGRERAIGEYDLTRLRHIARLLTPKEDPVIREDQHQISVPLKSYQPIVLMFMMVLPLMPR
jgi:hypothetical protein